MIKKDRKYIELTRTFLNQTQFDIISSYCTSMGYSLKYKTHKQETNIFNGKVQQTLYYDVIIEKDFGPKKRHGFLICEHNKFFLAYKYNLEDITNIVRTCPRTIKQDSRTFFEPLMFIKFNLQTV